MDDQSRNLILATALSFLVILGWFLLGPILFPDAFPPPVETTAQSTDPGDRATGTGTGPPRPTLTAAAPKSRAAALAETQRVPIRTAAADGSLSLTGRADRRPLADRLQGHRRPRLADRHPADARRRRARLLRALRLVARRRPRGRRCPRPRPRPGRVESGDVLTETTPVTLRWDNGAGLIFRQTIAVDANYMFTVTQSVENTTGAEVRLAPYGIVARHGTPPRPEELLHPARGRDHRSPTAS